LIGEMRTSLLLIIVLLISASCQPAGVILTKEGKIECGGDGKAIILKNNPAANNPTFDEMVTFIKADNTDSKEYVENRPNAYVCSDFAEEVHNKAEAAGIKAGWVSITFLGIEEGHALNCFETTDRGIVYIDCTNGGLDNDENEARGWDTVAYIEIGEKYGILDIDVVARLPDDYATLQYDFYAEREEEWLEYKIMLGLFNDEVDEYNREISGKVFTYGSPEEKRISAWEKKLMTEEKELKELEKKLGNSWYKTEYSEYIVKDVNIHW
jgi:hypothetical protein